MCYIFKEDEITPIQAKEDIPVFKVGDLLEGIFMSINRGARYEFGKEYRVEKFWEHLETSTLEGEYKTKIGLYSLETEDRAKEYLDNIIRFARYYTIFRARIFKAYIPKGSYYLKTDDNCYISDALVVLNEPLDYFPKLSKKFMKFYGDKVKPYIPENIISESE